MLDKQKVKLMTELAFYEQNHGKEDFKINEFYRKDYTGFYTLCSVLWVTVGYVCVLGIIALAALDFILANISQTMLIAMGALIIAGYLVTVVIYALLASHMYKKKHQEARQRMKIYNHNLTRLLKMYEGRKENG